MSVVKTLQSQVLQSSLIPSGSWKENDPFNYRWLKNKWWWIYLLNMLIFQFTMLNNQRVIVTSTLDPSCDSPRAPSPHSPAVALAAVIPQGKSEAWTSRCGVGSCHSLEEILHLAWLKHVETLSIMGWTPYQPAQDFFQSLYVYGCICALYCTCIYAI